MNFENDVKEPKKEVTGIESVRKTETHSCEFHEPHKLIQVKHEPSECTAVMVPFTDSPS